MPQHAEESTSGLDAGLEAGLEAGLTRPRLSWSKARTSIQSCLLNMLLCCCWPVHKCVTVLSCFDTLIAAIFAYKSFNVLYDTFSEPHWTTVLLFLFFLAFFICQIIATVFVILAYKRNIDRYCYPRLVLLAGHFLCSALATVICIFYFYGGSTRMNSFFFSLYEYFFESVLDEKERIELKHEMRLYAGAFLALTFTFCIYSLFEFLLMRKFFKTLNSFQPVPTTDGTAPHAQPAFNPNYDKPSTSKNVYPNLA